MTTAHLESLNYRCREAPHAEAALHLLEASPEIELLLTDVVLPGGTSGASLAQEVRRIRPGIRVLFVSGYSESELVRNGRMEPGVELLEKPFAGPDLPAPLLVPCALMLATAYWLVGQQRREAGRRDSSHWR